MNSGEDNLRKVLKDNFEVPDGYFDELSEKISDNIVSIPDLEKKGITPFNVPENYFEKLPLLISDRIAKEKNQLFAWKRIFQPRLVIPLACLIILAGVFYITKMKTTDETEPFVYIDEISPSYIESFDEEVMADILFSGTETETIDSLSQYLLDNNIELSEITNAL